MEVFRPLDGLAEEVTALSPPLEQWRKFIYCERVTGSIYGEVDHFRVIYLFTSFSCLFKSSSYIRAA